MLFLLFGFGGLAGTDGGFAHHQGLAYFDVVDTQAIGRKQFSADGYFWADTREGTNVVLLGQAQEGKNRMSSVDAKGFPMVQAIIEAGLKDGGGFTDYYFPKAGQTEPPPKRSYSLLSKSWGWLCRAIHSWHRTSRCRVSILPPYSLLVCRLLTLHMLSPWLVLA